MPIGARTRLPEWEICRDLNFNPGEYFCSVFREIYSDYINWRITPEQAKEAILALVRIRELDERALQAMIVREG